MKRYMLLVILVLFGVLVISGCMPKKVFTKPGITQAQWNKDFAQCEYEATSNTQNVDYSYQSVIVQSFEQGMRRRNLVELCLKAKGYVEQKGN